MYKNKSLKQFLPILTFLLILVPISAQARKNKVKNVQSSLHFILQKEEIPYLEINPESRRFFYAKTSNEYVFHTNSFVNTGVSVKRGDKITIKADGTIRFGLFAGSGGANGISFNPRYNFFTNIPHGQLIARIKQPGMRDLDGWFSVGEEREIIAQNSGILEFAVNDRQQRDNVGKFRIKVAIGSAQIQSGNSAQNPKPSQRSSTRKAATPVQESSVPVKTAQPSSRQLDARERAVSNYFKTLLNGDASQLSKHYCSSDKQLADSLYNITDRNGRKRSLFDTYLKIGLAINSVDMSNLNFETKYYDEKKERAVVAFYGFIKLQAADGQTIFKKYGYSSRYRKDWFRLIKEGGEWKLCNNFNR